MATADHAQQTQQPVLVIMGVSGSGKSTVAGILAGQLGWDLEEGDDLHPAANVAKMAAGIPLTDDDRWPWLDRVADWIRDHNMPTTLLDSQIDTLEPPGPDERVIVIDVGRKPAEEAAEIIERLNLHTEEGSSTLGS